MCIFFSFLTNGNGKYYYIKGEDRKRVIKSGENPDSYSFIVKFYQDKGELAIGNTVEDKLNKYEYYICEDGFKFHIDAINTKDDSEEAKKWVKNMFHPDNIDYNLFNSKHAYLYCKCIKDTKELRDKITDYYHAYLYCRDIKDTKEMRDKITDSEYAYWYCRDVKDTKEMMDKITDSEYAYRYCRDVKDTKEMRDRITDQYWIYKYHKFVK